jgi:ketosteroid isomerase-like protein
VDPNERAIRDLYHARAQRDWDAVEAMLAEDIVWHEQSEEDYSGDYRGRREVVELLQKLVAVTGGAFQLVPEAFLNSVEHSAVLVRWSTERTGTGSEGQEIVVYRLRAGDIAEAWFHPDGCEPEALSAVSGTAERSPADRNSGSVPLVGVFRRRPCPRRRESSGRS